MMMRSENETGCLMCGFVARLPYGYVGTRTLSICSRTCNDAWNKLSFEERQVRIDKATGKGQCGSPGAATAAFARSGN
ncbi:MAG: hypothetical protein HY432_02870 [Candidatus Liptonbacteria bacterium]|nr:hypothetical protein [Candidatus Liptonbacteria bacterium]